MSEPGTPTIEQWTAALPDDLLIDDLWQLSTRARNGLKNAGCFTVGAARRARAIDLIRAPNVGRLTLREIRRLFPEPPRRPPVQFDDLPPGMPALDELPPGGPPDVETLEQTTRALVVPEDVPPAPSQLQAATDAADYTTGLMQMGVPLDDATYGLIANHFTVLKQFRDRIAAEMDEDIRRAHQLHKSLCDRRATYLRPIEDAEKHLRSIGGQYVQAREAEARRVAEQERQAAEAERAAQAKREADAALAAGQPKEVAEQTREFALQRPLPAARTVVPPPPRVTGLASRKYWDVFIDEPQKVPREWCTPNEKLIQAHVDANKGVCSIPGVRVQERTSTVRGGRRS